MTERQVEPYEAVALRKLAQFNESQAEEAAQVAGALEGEAVVSALIGVAVVSALIGVAVYRTGADLASALADDLEAMAHA